MVVGLFVCLFFVFWFFFVCFFFVVFFFIKEIKVKIISYLPVKVSEIDHLTLNQTYMSFPSVNV